MQVVCNVIDQGFIPQNVYSLPVGSNSDGIVFINCAVDRSGDIIAQSVLAVDLQPQLVNHLHQKQTQDYLGQGTNSDWHVSSNSPTWYLLYSLGPRVLILQLITWWFGRHCISLPVVRQLLIVLSQQALHLFVRHQELNFANTFTKQRALNWKLGTNLCTI